MNSWMKRRINRSRARCHKTLAESKKARRAQLKSEKNEQVATNLRADSHPASDK
jgi:hypothetical protein